MGKKLLEKSQQYLDVYHRSYLPVWEKIILTAINIHGDVSSTYDKSQQYKLLEEKINEHSSNMLKIAENADWYLNKLENKLEFEAVKVQSVFYYYQFKKILISIYQFRYESNVSKKNKHSAQKNLLEKFNELSTYYVDHVETILKINPEEELTMLIMQLDFAIHVKDANGEMLSPIEKELKAADLSRDPDSADARFQKAIALAETDIVRYEILKRRMSSYLAKEKERIGNEYYKTSADADQAKLKYGIYYLDRMKEKLNLLENLNKNRVYDKEEKNCIEGLISFTKIFLDLKEESVLMGLANLLRRLVDQYPEYEDKYQEIKTMVDAAVKVEFKVEEEIEIDVKIMAEELPVKSMIRRKKSKNKPYNKHAEDTGYISDIDEKRKEIPEEITEVIIVEELLSEIVVKLNEAEEHKRRAELALKKNYLQAEAIDEFIAAKNALSESLQLYKSTEEQDKSLLDSIQLVITHTELLLEQAVQSEKRRVERFNISRDEAKKYIIETYGPDAWYKNTSHQLSDHARNRIEAIENFNQLQTIYKEVKEIKTHLHPTKDFLTERQSVIQYFRFFRNTCPADNPARILKRSCSVDSFLSPENQACLNELNKRYGR